jgi:hypothetical protein
MSHGNGNSLTMGYSPCYSILIGGHDDLHLHLAEVRTLKDICEHIIMDAERQAGILPKHNHTTNDIKEPGKCPRCDLSRLYHDEDQVPRPAGPAVTGQLVRPDGREQG